MKLYLLIIIYFIIYLIIQLFDQILLKYYYLLYLNWLVILSSMLKWLNWKVLGFELMKLARD